MERNAKFPAERPHAEPAAERSSAWEHGQPRNGADRPHGLADAIFNSPRLAAQRKLSEGIQNSPRMVAQRRQIERMSAAAARPMQRGSGVVQGAFIVGGVPIAGAALDLWIQNNVPKNSPHVAAMIRSWDQDANYNTNHASDIDAYIEADSKSKDKILSQNSTVAHGIVQGPPNAVDWATVPVWAAWYFSGLEYQDNKTGGWHSNRQGWLPHGATVDGRPTRYVEFRRPGAVGDKEADKLERCIFDLLSGRCWPNAHYDGGYVEITNVPAPIKTRLMNIACVATGIKERKDRMTPQEIQAAGVNFAQIQWLLTTLNAEMG